MACFIEILMQNSRNFFYARHFFVWIWRSFAEIIFLLWIMIYLSVLVFQICIEVCFRIFTFSRNLLRGKDSCIAIIKKRFTLKLKFIFFEITKVRFLFYLLASYICFRVDSQASAPASSLHSFPIYSGDILPIFDLMDMDTSKLWNLLSHAIIKELFINMFRMLL